jgi:anti-sigma regulatory factor (Ser/Thr protein kinase)
VPTDARAVTLAVNVPHQGHGVSLARHAFATDLASVGVTDDVRQDVMLVISELVSNAVRHAAALPGDSVGVTCGINDDCLHIEITDGGSLTRPSPEVATVFAQGGRGLDIVRMISREWGVTQDGDTVTVWADVPRVRKHIADADIEATAH